MGSCLGCEMWITQHCLEQSATGFQPESLLALVLERVGFCVFLALDRTVLTRGAGKKNRELFFVEQLELERGGENVPTRSPSNRAALAGWEAAGMLARITVGSTGSHCALPAGLCKIRECFPAPHLFSSLLCTTWFLLGVNGAAEGSLIRIKSL